MSEVAEQGMGSTSQPSTPALHIPERMEDRRREVVRIATKTFAAQPDWVTFVRQILGAEGVVGQMFPESDDYKAFTMTEEYREILQMLAKLRDQPAKEPEGKEPIRVITVRIPKSVHDFLRKEAETHSTSINQLCITKLLQYLDGEEELEEEE